MHELKIDKVKESENKELERGEAFKLSCSNCNALLASIDSTRPYESQIWKLRANCPFCGDKSFIKEIKGGFHYGGVGIQSPYDEDDTLASTMVDRFDIENGIVEFKVIKADKNAKPIY